VRAVLDEVFGDDNFASIIAFQSTTSLGTIGLSAAGDYIVWYHKNKSRAKFRPLMRIKTEKTRLRILLIYSAQQIGRMWRGTKDELEAPESHIFFPDNITSQRSLGEGDFKGIQLEESFFPTAKGRSRRTNGALTDFQKQIVYTKHREGSQVCPTH